MGQGVILPSGLALRGEMPRRRKTPVAPPAPEPAKMGRPLADINWADVATMASNFCPTEDIASVVGVSACTIERRCLHDHGITFAAWADQRRSGSRNALRNMQLKTALSGNIVMMIWLGKQLLRQTDKVIKYDSAWAREQDRDELIKKGQEAIAVLEERGAVGE